jgi:K+-sensing histidine kinase KdpD
VAPKCRQPQGFLAALRLAPELQSCPGMMPAPWPQDEEARLEALTAHGVLDTLPEQDFDDLTQLASAICGVPIALVSLVDRERQWFKSRVGLEASETPRDVAFCAHAILKDEVFVVPDATRDPRFHDNPLVTGGPQVRFYAGTPLKSQSGHAVGTLCVIDHKPRQLTPEQLQALRRLGRQVEGQLRLRLQLKELERREAESHAQREALSRMQRQKDELLRLVMKDLHAPLASIQSTASFVQYLSHLPERVCTAARDIRELSEGIQRMVANLLEANSEEASLVLRETRFDVSALLAEAAHGFFLRTRSTHRQFTHNLRVPKQCLVGDRELLGRVLENLLDNSFRYTALGAGRITLEASEPEPGVLEVRVRDEGPGIPAAARPHLFQLHPPEGAATAARGRASNSLGLAFCRRAVEAHGGWIWAEDNQPRGVTFCLRLPVRTDTAQELMS